MRLIDADNLLTAFPAGEDEIFHTSAVRGTINACQTVDSVPAGAYKQVRWERDIALQQLDTLGYGLGEKVAPVVQLPSAQQWIPTSERLPEGICQVIVQTNGGAIHDVFYEGKNAYGHEVWMMVDGGIYWDDEVVAWMPLPKPYKEAT